MCWLELIAICSLFRIHLAVLEDLKNCYLLMHVTNQQSMRGEHLQITFLPIPLFTSSKLNVGDCKQLIESQQYTNIYCHGLFLIIVWKTIPGNMKVIEK